MRKFLSSRRGSAAFATVVALVPLIGAVSLGAEAGSWYVTKQHAQNAADAAATAGGVTLACSIGQNYGLVCADNKPAQYRGKEVAAQNAFCNSGDTTSYPGSLCGTLPGQSVAIRLGSFSGGVFTVDPSGTNPADNAVQTVVGQSQQPLLASLFITGNVNINTQAVALVNASAIANALTSQCILALTGSLSFQGSPNINAVGCSMATNNTTSTALNFTGGGATFNPGLVLSAAGGCSGSFCSDPDLTINTHRPSIINPFSSLDSITMPTLNNCSKGGLTASSAATSCKNNNVKLSGMGNTSVNGVYFISGTLTLTGNTSISGTALFILLPGASIDTKGGGSINIAGIPDVTSSQVPATLQPYSEPSCKTTSPPSCLLNNMAIYDKSNVDVSIGGNSNINFDGNMYLPNAAVTLQGNPTLNNSSCEQLIAGSIAFNGNPTLNVSGCSPYTPQATAPSRELSQYVSLVQ